MRRTTILVLSLVCGLLLMACTKTETTNNSNTAVVTSTPASATTPASGTTTAASTSADSVGVPECDDFIAKYEACVNNKVPEMVRPQFQASIKQWKDSWKKLADNPQTKPTLVSACKQSLEQAKTSLGSYGCTW